MGILDLEVFWEKIQVGKISSKELNEGALLWMVGVGCPFRQFCSPRMHGLIVDLARWGASPLNDWWGNHQAYYLTVILLMLKQTKVAWCFLSNLFVSLWLIAGGELWCTVLIASASVTNMCGAVRLRNCENSKQQGGKEALEWHWRSTLLCLFNLCTRDKYKYQSERLDRSARTCTDSRVECSRSLLILYMVWQCLSGAQHYRHYRPICQTVLSPITDHHDHCHSPRGGS